MGNKTTTNTQPRLKVLIACEESQTVCKAFRALGHEAYSCDIKDCSGGKPEWHIKRDVIEIISQGWDMLIGFPPCTHLAVSGARHFREKIKDGRQQEGIDFFLKLANCGIRYIALENPVGIMSSKYKKPTQIIQPWQFGDSAQKTTCLWLKNLPTLKHTKVVDKGLFYVSPSGKKMPSWCSDPIGKNGKKLAYNSEEIKTLRSKTFPGIANAMAAQWSKVSGYQAELF